MQALAESCRAAGDVGLIETHISRVLLCGADAYKFKRPVDLGFLDYSTLERRAHFCREEVRLNRRTAPDLYIEASAVSEGGDGIRFGGEPAVEYAVKMRRFDERDLMSRMLAEGRLAPSHIDRLARMVAAFHAGLEGTLEYGTPEAVYAPMAQNFAQIRQFSEVPPPALEALTHWTESRYRKLHRLLERRHRKGFIRECHGDLHLNNVVFHAGRPQAFDGIEFNPELRFIDTVSEIAFLTMDLTERGHAPLAWRFLNAYLEGSGDYAGLALLRFYQTYRAVVRAKVAAIRLHQLGNDDALRAERDGYLALAQQFTRPPVPFLLLTCGVSGSGKTRLSQMLLEALGLIRIRSDVERKRLYGLPADANSASALSQGIYTAQATDRTYERLETVADGLLADGLPVIVDATFPERERRDRFAALARRHGIPFAILYARAPETVLRERVARRRAAGGDASEADLAVLERQLRRHVPPGDDEPVVAIATDTAVSSGALMEQVRMKLGLT